ncbi:MAG: heavy-metal-associated domain-containing protein [Gemmatimonadaceae bacterium]
MHTTTHLQIAGMNGIHAVRAIETALTMVNGITLMEVRVGSAVIEHDGRATTEALRAAIEVAGFELTGFREERRGLCVIPDPGSASR